MCHAHSVSQWITAIQSGNDEAARQLWERYVDRLMDVARLNLGEFPRKVADEEDVLISVFDGLIQSMRKGAFSKLNDRDDLWRILLVLTERRAIDQIRRETAAKRGGGNVKGESVFGTPVDPAAQTNGWDQVAGREPSPEFAREFAEEMGRLLDRLDDATLKEVALRKLDGSTNKEISTSLDISLRSVQRKLDLIRRSWNEGHS